MINYLKLLFGLFLAKLRGTQYKMVNGNLWVKEKQRDWELFSEHINREHK